MSKDNTTDPTSRRGHPAKGPPAPRPTPRPQWHNLGRREPSGPNGVITGAPLRTTAPFRANS